MGILYATPSRGKEIFSFEYDKAWLKDGRAQSLDLSLRLYHGRQYVPEGQDNFGIFLDSAPDRWGRLLMRRREALLAKEAGRAERLLLESDYLLGVYDGHRMGGLRFRIGFEGPFLDSNTEFASPPWATLRELEQASLHLESEGSEKRPDYKKWLRMLMIPGSSLGGARPKSGVIDESGELWIAKFPSRHDSVDQGAWEFVAHELAKSCGVSTPIARVEKFTHRYHTFFSKRFDRTERGDRRHFTSAMTLLQRRDGEDADAGVSYLELARFIMQQGGRPTEDLKQLWLRIVFFMFISNVDDHLRNHGFILESSGWVLAPAYDMNPDPLGDGLKLNVSETDNSQNLELALNVAKHFRLKTGAAELLIRKIQKTVKNWKKVAGSCGLSKNDQKRMARAFRLAEGL